MGPPINIRIGHEDDVVVAAALDIKCFRNTGSYGGNQGLNLDILQNLMRVCLLDIQDLTF